MQNKDKAPFSSPEEAIELIEQSNEKTRFMAMQAFIAGIAARAFRNPGPHKFKHPGSKKGYKAPQATRKAPARRDGPIMTNNERVVWGRCLRRGLTVMQYRELYPHG